MQYSLVMVSELSTLTEYSVGILTGQPDTQSILFGDGVGLGGQLTTIFSQCLQQISLTSNPIIVWCGVGLADTDNNIQSVLQLISRTPKQY